MASRKLRKAIGAIINPRKTISTRTKSQTLKSVVGTGTGTQKLASEKVSPSSDGAIKTPSVKKSSSSSIRTPSIKEIQSRQKIDQKEEKKVKESVKQLEKQRREAGRKIRGEEERQRLLEKRRKFREETKVGSKIQEVREKKESFQEKVIKIVEGDIEKLEERLEELGPRGKKIAELIRKSETKPGDLPFGLQSVIDLEPEVVSGEKATVFTPINVLSRKIGESGFSDFVLREIKKKNPKIGEFLDRPVSKKAMDTITLLQLGVLFEPAFAAGAAGKTKTTKQVQVQKAKTKKASKEQVKKVIEDLKFKREGNVLKEKSNFEKVKDISDIFNKIRQIEDPAIRKQSMAQFKRLLIEAHGEDGARALLQEFLAQEGVVVSATPKSFTQATERIAPIQTGISELGMQAPGLIPGSGILTSQTQLFFAKEAQAQIPKTKQDQRTKQALKNIFLQAQAQRTGQIPKQAQVSKGRLKAVTASLFFKPSPQIRRVPRKPVVPKPKKKFPVEKIPKKQEERIRKALNEIKRQGKSVDIITGITGKRKERVLKKNVAPNRAYKIAQDFVDRNIQASFRLKTNPKKPPRKDIKKAPISGKFRPSKTNPLFLVEKRKFRLDSPKERKQIKKARRKTTKKKSKK